jgi:hypothetical protein
VSSILEALRELEGERPPATRREIPPPERPPGVTRAAGAFIPLIGGLAVGMVAFALYAWGPALVGPRPASESTSTHAAAPADTKPAEPPTWLDTAAPPRARVDPGPPPAAERAPARPQPAPTATAPGDEPHDDPAPSSSGGQVAVEAIKYTDEPGGRVATIRFKGRRVTLRQREAVDGIEVQLIMPNGVYVQRGSETYMLPLSR